MFRKILKFIPGTRVEVNKIKACSLKKIRCYRVDFLSLKFVFLKNRAIPYFVESLILVSQMKALVKQSSTKIFPKFKSKNFLRYAN